MITNCTYFIQIYIQNHLARYRVSGMGRFFFKRVQILKIQVNKQKQKYIIKFASEHAFLLTY